MQVALAPAVHLPQECSRVATHCPSYQLPLPLLLLPHKSSAEMMKDLLMGDQNLSFNKCVVGSIGKTSSSITEKFRLTGTGLPNTSRKLSCANIKDLCHGQVESKLHLLTDQLPFKNCMYFLYTETARMVFVHSCCFSLVIFQKGILMKPHLKTAF